jgi:hypothetical protein
MHHTVPLLNVFRIMLPMCSVALRSLIETILMLTEIIVRNKLMRLLFYLCLTCQGNNTESLTNVMQHVLPVWQCVFIYAYILFIYVCACMFVHRHHSKFILIIYMHESS